MAQSQPNRPKVLVADDDENIIRLLEYHFKKHNFEIVTASSIEEVKAIQIKDICVALMDLAFPNIDDGLASLAWVKSKFPNATVITISAKPEVKHAVEAMNHGAMHYITKPFEMEEVLSLVRNASSVAKVSKEHEKLTNSFQAPKAQKGGFRANSSKTIELLDRVRENVAPWESNVLITGESGVGKSLLAQSIHTMGPRANRPFVTVNCTALPRELIESEIFGHEKGAFTGAHQQRIGKLEQANGGTIFLDEIGDLPIDLQPKFLTVLQQQSFQRVGGTETINVDVRVISATNVDLYEKVRRKEFREDLYYRLNVIQLEIPALRERPEDLSDLVDRFIENISAKRNARYSIAADAKRCLVQYRWPGNVRELENVLECAASFCHDNVIRAADLRPEVRNGLMPISESEGDEMTKLFERLAGLTSAEVEKRHLLATLNSCHNNKAEAARRLDISEKSVYNRLKRMAA